MSVKCSVYRVIIPIGSKPIIILTPDLMNSSFEPVFTIFLFQADGSEDKIISLETELKVVGDNMKSMEVNKLTKHR